MKFDDEDRGVYQFEIDKPSQSEYHVAKCAIWCLAVEYFETPEKVVSYIEN
ncbi:hypothetical protein [Sporosarcina jiandibaonis]|uniref:hypothetical protein n=1 Tax=Sporosarcina jiandibaonis TaxID=2715535 RepID=UPI00155314CE|nr:hypothetical protein [Sporosarcina jiandibaonis]